MNLNFSRRNIIIGIVIALVAIAIPVTVFLAQHQQILRSRAAGEWIPNDASNPQTEISFIPQSGSVITVGQPMYVRVKAKFAFAKVRITGDVTGGTDKIHPGDPASDCGADLDFPNCWRFAVTADKISTAKAYNVTFMAATCPDASDTTCPVNGAVAGGFQAVAAGTGGSSGGTVTMGGKFVKADGSTIGVAGGIVPARGGTTPTSVTTTADGSYTFTPNTGVNLIALGPVTCPPGFSNPRTTIAAGAGGAAGNASYESVSVAARNDLNFTCDGPSGSGTPVNVGGKVTDADTHAALPNLTVKLYKSSTTAPPQEVGSTSSGSDGSYSFGSSLIQTDNEYAVRILAGPSGYNFPATSPSGGQWEGQKTGNSCGTACNFTFTKIPVSGIDVGTCAVTINGETLDQFAREGKGIVADQDSTLVIQMTNTSLGLGAGQQNPWSGNGQNQGYYIKYTGGSANQLGLSTPQQQRLFVNGSVAIGGSTTFDIKIHPVAFTGTTTQATYQFDWQMNNDKGQPFYPGSGLCTPDIQVFKTDPGGGTGGGTNTCPGGGTSGFSAGTNPINGASYGTWQCQPHDASGSVPQGCNGVGIPANNYSCGDPGSGGVQLYCLACGGTGTVKFVPEITDLHPDSGSYRSSGSALLTWTINPSTDRTPTSCNINGQLVTAASSSQSFTLPFVAQGASPVTQTFTMKCSNQIGPAIDKTISVQVNPQSPAPTITLTPNRYDPSNGDTIQLNWAVTPGPGRSIVGNCSVSSVPSNDAWNPGTQRSANGSPAQVVVTNTTTQATFPNSFSISCTDDQGNVGTQNLSIAVKSGGGGGTGGGSCPVGTNSTQARMRKTGTSNNWVTSGLTITVGQSADIAGFHNNAIGTGNIAADITHIRATGPAGDPASGTFDLAKDSNTNFAPFAPTLPGVYTITVDTDSSNGSGNCHGSADITVNAAAPTQVTVHANPNPVDPGGSVAITWDITGLKPTGCAASGDWTHTFTDAEISVGTANDGKHGPILVTAPTNKANAAYTITCDQTVTDTANITVSLPGVTLTTSPNNPNPGGTINLTWTITGNPTSCTASWLNNGAGGALTNITPGAHSGPTDPQGVYVIPANTAPGTQIPFTVTCLPADKFSPVTTNVTVVAAPTPTPGPIKTVTSCFVIGEGDKGKTDVDTVTTASVSDAATYCTANVGKTIAAGNATVYAYAGGTTKIPNYTFKDTTPGLKTFFFKFIGVQNGTTTIVSTRQQQSINFLPGPAITNASCTTASSGAGTHMVITGTSIANLQNNANLTLANNNAIITSWTTDNVSGVTTITADISQRLSGINQVNLALSNGTTLTGRCVINTTSAAFSAAIQCLTAGNFASSNVKVSVYEGLPITTQAVNPDPILQQIITLDADGKPQGFAPQFENNKIYELIFKAPGTLASRADFKTGSGGTVQINGGDAITLRQGDIFPLSKPDGVVNSFDKAELTREWSIVTDVTRNGDLNKDGRVNSVDYACMRLNINASDATYSALAVSPAPTAAPSGGVTPTPTPVPSAAPTSSPAASASPTPTPTPTPSPSPASSANPNSFVVSLNGSFPTPGPGGANPSQTQQGVLNGSGQASATFNLAPGLNTIFVQFPGSPIVPINVFYTAP